MKNKLFLIVLLLVLITAFSSCAAIGTIFKAGMGFGIFIVVIIVAIVIFIISRMGKNK